MKLFPAVETSRAHNLLKLEGDTMNDARKLASTHVCQGQRGGLGLISLSMRERSYLMRSISPELYSTW